MGDPSGEDEAVASFREREGNIGDDLLVAGQIRDEGSVNLSERVGCARIEVVLAEVGRVNVQYASRSAGVS